MKKALFILIAALLLITVSACASSRNGNPSATPTSGTTSPTEAGPATNPVSKEPAIGGDLRTAAIIFDFSSGSAEPNLRQETENLYEDITPDDLANALGLWSGLDFFVTVSYKDDGGIVVDWAKNSTLIANLDDREQKEDFAFFDAESMRWFMMDSMYQTLKENYYTDEIYYTMDGGKELVFDELFPINVFPSDIPYMGSPFYFAHDDVRGDDGDLLSNFEYIEEYEIQGDSGDYLNAAEAAILTFDMVKNNGSIPDYSDNTVYTMVLVDLTDIDGEECYVYRLDVADPTGTIGAAYAYAYQSGNVYIQGEGNKWVQTAAG